MILPCEAGEGDRAKPGGGGTADPSWAYAIALPPGGEARVRRLAIRYGSPLLRAARLAVVAVGLPLALAGCFRPLYGPTPSGVPLQDALASIEVSEPQVSRGQERFGHYLRSELIFDLDGSGTPHEKTYKLALVTSESIRPSSVDVSTGRADAAILNGAVQYTLTTNDGKQVAVGTSRGSATYYRDEQRFASVRAARDADIRVAQLIADDIKQRLAALLATTP